MVTTTGSDQEKRLTKNVNKVLQRILKMENYNFV